MFGGVVYVFEFIAENKLSRGATAVKGIVRDYCLLGKRHERLGHGKRDMNFS